MEDWSSISPLTRDEAWRIARGISRYPDSVQHVPYSKLEYARYGRGYAFSDMVGYLLIIEGGGMSHGILTDGRTIQQEIDQHLAKAAHVNRDLPLDELGLAQRLAVQAFDAGADVIDAATVDHAQYLLIAMRRSRGRSASGAAVLARTDYLLEPPTPGRRYTHPCPICGRPALHQDRYPASVCDACFDRTTDSAGRRVAGANTGFSGGFVAHYVDGQREECVEVTSTGRCYIDGREVRMGEARFGGIVVQTVDRG